MSLRRNRTAVTLWLSTGSWLPRDCRRAPFQPCVFYGATLSMVGTGPVPRFAYGKVQMRLLTVGGDTHADCIRWDRCKLS